MSESEYPRMVFSERLSAGIIVHFEEELDKGVSIYFPASFLYEQRDAQSNKIFHDDKEQED